MVGADKGPLSRLGNYQILRLKLLDGSTDADAADMKLLTKLVFRGELIPHLPLLFRNFAEQNVVHFIG